MMLDLYETAAQLASAIATASSPRKPFFCARMSTWLPRSRADDLTTLSPLHTMALDAMLRAELAKLGLQRTGPLPRSHGVPRPDLQAGCSPGMTRVDWNLDIELGEVSELQEQPPRYRSLGEVVSQFTGIPVLTVAPRLGAAPWRLLDARKWGVHDVWLLGIPNAPVSYGEMQRKGVARALADSFATDSPQCTLDTGVPLTTGFTIGMRFLHTERSDNWLLVAERFKTLESAPFDLTGENSV